MKKAIAVGLTLGCFLIAGETTAFAGQWQANEYGWWYDNGNGTYPANCWQWIDGNNDGTAECYYFNQLGYCLTNGTTPDGYWVNGDGAWTVDGYVQTKHVGFNTADSKASDNKEKDAVMLYNLDPIISSRKIGKSTSAVTNKENDSWAKVLYFQYEYAGSMGERDAYAEYYTAGQYDTFKATVAPLKSSTWNKTNYVYLQILGEDDELLYESDEITYKTSAFPVVVDISGQDTVSIYVIKGEGTRAPIIMKNARFE